MIEANPPTVKGYGTVTLAAVAALLSATGRPYHKAMSLLMGWGIPDAVARIALHVAPVILVVAAIMLGRAIGRGRSSGVRWTVYGVLGAVAGAAIAFCLDLFAGVPDLIARAFGALAKPTFFEIALWALAGMGLWIGLVIGAMALFGRPAVRALQVDEVDPDCVDVRNSERRVFGWSAIGMVTLGVACAGLAIARQAAPDARLAPVLIAVVAAIVSVVANYVLWRGFDELQRRHVVEGYAASAIVATLGAFTWGLAQALGVVPALDATGVFLTLIVVQMVAVSYVTSSVVGQMSAMGKPA